MPPIRRVADNEPGGRGGTLSSVGRVSDAMRRFAFATRDVFGLELARGLVMSWLLVKDHPI